ncbi:Repetin [Streptomyces sp. NPDC056296]|uniref:Repetin n=1 Tax=Streptomyces sp. NPDC056296 TaxID=3345775 RepID=UPI0035DB6FEF
MNRRTMTAALCAALLLTAVTTGAAVASGPHEERPPREAAALTGTAELYRSAGDDITFTFDAHLAAEDNDDPLRATGTFEFSHYVNGEGARAKADVDCLLTGGDVAVVSGVITDSDLPGAEGKRVGVTVHDQGRHDRLGYSWAATGSPAEGAELPRCVSSAPFEKVRKGTGDFEVVPWQPRL